MSRRLNPSRVVRASQRLQARIKRENTEARAAQPLTVNLKINTCEAQKHIGHLQQAVEKFAACCEQHNLDASKFRDAIWLEEDQPDAATPQPLDLDALALTAKLRLHDQVSTAGHLASVAVASGFQLLQAAHEARLACIAANSRHRVAVHYSMVSDRPINTARHSTGLLTDWGRP